MNLEFWLQEGPRTKIGSNVEKEKELIEQKLRRDYNRESFSTMEIVNGVLDHLWEKFYDKSKDSIVKTYNVFLDQKGTKLISKERFESIEEWTKRLPFSIKSIYKKAKEHPEWAKRLPPMTKGSYGEPLSPYDHVNDLNWSLYLQINADTILKHGILQGNPGKGAGGACFDYNTVFVTLTRSFNIPTMLFYMYKRWYGKKGIRLTFHGMSQIYDRERGQWKIIDSKWTKYRDHDGIVELEAKYKARLNKEHYLKYGFEREDGSIFLESGLDIEIDHDSGLEGVLTSVKEPPIFEKSKRVYIPVSKSVIPFIREIASNEKYAELIPRHEVLQMFKPTEFSERTGLAKIGIPGIDYAKLGILDFRYAMILSKACFKHYQSRLK
jgi:hypothetical protein